jgi:hypothetical protein
MARHHRRVSTRDNLRSPERLGHTYGQRATAATTTTTSTVTAPTLAPAPPKPKPPRSTGPPKLPPGQAKRTEGD